MTAGFTSTALRRLPIGVFDSGVGGLTVLRALHERLPHEALLYLGDMARLPYGSKSPQTVSRYALQAAGMLVARGIKLLVVACNTASALALDDLRAAFPQIPVIGVLEPGAAAACAATRSGRIAVIATEGTVNGGAYTRAIHAIRPDCEVSAAPCPLFVALAEEGWHDGPVLEAVARRYLDPLFATIPPDVLVLGCTHFPVLAATLAAVVGPQTRLVDSASTTAEAVRETLRETGLGAPSSDTTPTVHYLTTDTPERFARVAAGFLPAALHPREVELIDL
ncbi:glutamate racemase [Acidihalobacter ferrooxydans]|uniref:Glutamate racemase n=1 Tax=Acidihalobacter ferrooxydans TaxID=1765967 RepID=A0A1P8UJP4_9GAMM|nr:glutamate racemase [Acidihalobacter ferrooxydans]APZ44049.1 glutamate racemase [Acidihalobacter ferrooxydans]